MHGVVNIFPKSLPMCHVILKYILFNRGEYNFINLIISTYLFFFYPNIRIISTIFWHIFSLFSLCNLYYFFIILLPLTFYQSFPEIWWGPHFHCHCHSAVSLSTCQPDKGSHQAFLLSGPYRYSSSTFPYTYNSLL